MLMVRSLSFLFLSFLFFFVYGCMQLFFSYQAFGFLMLGSHLLQLPCTIICEIGLIRRAQKQPHQLFLESPVKPVASYHLTQFPLYSVRNRHHLLR